MISGRRRATTQNFRGTKFHPLRDKKSRFIELQNFKRTHPPSAKPTNDGSKDPQPGKGPESPSS